MRYYSPRLTELQRKRAISDYLNARINAAIRFCREPVHPFEEKPAPDPRKRGASHSFKLGVTRRDYYAR